MLQKLFRGLQKKGPSKVVEEVDPQPSSAKVNFRRSLSLEERVQLAVRSQLAEAERARRAARDRADFDSVLPDDEFHSEHELVFDEDSGKEVTKAQKRVFDEARTEFDSYVTQQRKVIAEKKKKEKKELIAPEKVDP